MKRFNRITTSRLLLLLVVVALGWAGSGCGTTEAENTSQRPWNSPEGWQNGNIPSMMTPH